MPGKCPDTDCKEKTNELHLSMCGSKETGIKGFIKETREYREKRDKALDITLADIGVKLEADHDLLVLNRVAFGFWCLVKKPVSWLVFILLAGAIFGMDIAEIIERKLF